MAFKITPNVRVKRDHEGFVRHLQHLQEPYFPAKGVAATPRAVAAAACSR